MTLVVFFAAAALSLPVQLTPIVADIKGGIEVTLFRETGFESPEHRDVRCGFGSRWVPGVLRPDLKTILCTVPPAPGGLPGNVTIRLRIDPLPEDQGSALLVYCKPSAAAESRSNSRTHSRMSRRRRPCHHTRGNARGLPHGPDSSPARPSAKSARRPVTTPFSSCLARHAAPEHR